MRALSFNFMALLSWRTNTMGREGRIFTASNSETEMLIFSEKIKLELHDE